MESVCSNCKHNDIFFCNNRSCENYGMPIAYIEDCNAFEEKEESCEVQRV